MSIVDIAFIGSGAATTTTLIELFDKLINGPLSGIMLNITVIDKYPEFWKGIPYGARSSVNSLTITPVSDFVSTGKERELFFKWLKINLDDLFNYYSLNGGMAAEGWLADNSAALKNEEWDKVYIPRFIWGIYMQNKLLTLLKTAEEKQLVQVTLIQAEAIDVEKLTGGLFNVRLEHPDKKQTTITVKKLVVAIGSAPVKTYEMPGADKPYTYINDLYAPLLDDNIKALRTTLAATENAAERNVLLIGSNASSIELLYLLNNRPDVTQQANKIVSISRAGCMPYHISDTRLEHYPTLHLDAIKTSGNYNIHTLVKAAKKDIEQAIQNHVVRVPYVDRIIGYTIELMQVLGEEAKKIFFGTYGMQLTRLIRRSGPAYKNASEALLQTQQLLLVKGEFAGITQQDNTGLLNYIDPVTGQQQTYNLPFRVIINCTGADDLENSSSRLIYNLVNKHICRVNLSGKGFEVNDRFEAASNLYVIGPLLGGNMNKRIYFWHIENLARLLYLSPYLADCLLAGKGILHHNRKASD